MKHLGIITVILGALMLIIPNMCRFESNKTLAVAAVLLVVGIILHIVFAKMGIDNDSKK